MRTTRAEGPMSIYDYDQQERSGGDECKLQESADGEIKSSMKALRLLDQSQVRTTKEATRNHNSNMNALKLLDEVAGEDTIHKPEPTVMPGIDLSPKQYSEDDDVKEDDVAEVDNFRRYKSSDHIAREKVANYKALKKIDALFAGAAANEKAKRASTSMRAAVAAKTAPQKETEEVQPLDTSPMEYTGQEDAGMVDPGEDVQQYKKSVNIHREKVANYKALKKMDTLFGSAAANENENQVSMTVRAAGVTGNTMSKNEPDVVQPLDTSPKEYTGDEDADNVDPDENVKKYKKSKNIRREEVANYKALKKIDALFGGAAANEKAKRPSTTMRAAAAAKAPTPKKEEEVVQPLDTSPKQYTGEADAKEGDSGESVKKYKNSKNIHREKVANFKALKKMDSLFGGAAKDKAPRSTPHAAGGKSMRAAAAEKYAKEKEQKYQAQAMIQVAKQNEMESRPKMLVAEKKLEDMATTTRKKRVTSEDVRDPETVAGMKCELDYDREKAAENKALELVNSSYVQGTSFV